MSNAFTFYFNDIFQSYEDWKNATTLLNIVNYDDTSESEFDVKCFNLLMLQFGKQNIRYSEPDSFVCQLMIIYDDKFKQFKKEKELINKLYKLTDDELIQINELLTNMANNPNTEISNPKKPLEYISAQTYQTTNDSKLKAYLMALNNVPTNNNFKFLNEKTNENGMSFKDLFMNVQPPILDFYEKGSDDDEYF